MSCFAAAALDRAAFSLAALPSLRLACGHKTMMRTPFGDQDTRDLCCFSLRWDCDGNKRGHEESVTPAREEILTLVWFHVVDFRALHCIALHCVLSLACAPCWISRCAVSTLMCRISHIYQSFVRMSWSLLNRMKSQQGTAGCMHPLLRGSIPGS